MQLKKGEALSRLKDYDKISFSREVAETLGLESAIILEYCKSKKINFSNKEFEIYLKNTKKNHNEYNSEKNFWETCDFFYKN